MSGALYLNHNLMASNTANTLTAHYGRLATSTERLSSGLRINSAADDAAGLAIRELMRADIAALHQGARNVNDAISMIQTFDGALSVIDEKLIRMKELAEQAATGTYDSTQRLMIDSEFQAMADEINRIARSTDFNGIKIIDGAFEAKPTQVVGPDGKTYDVSMNGASVSIWPGASATMIGGWDVNGITNPGALVGNNKISITNANIPQINGNFLLVTPVNNTTNLPDKSQVSVSYNELANAGGVSFGTWTVSVTPPGQATITSSVHGASNFFSWDEPGGGPIHIQTSIVDQNGNQTGLTGNGNANWTVSSTPSFTSAAGGVTAEFDQNDPSILKLTIDLGNGNTIAQSWKLDGNTNGNLDELSKALARVEINLNIVDTTPVPGADEPQFDDPLKPNYKIPEDVIRVHFGPGADSAEDFYDINRHDATIKGLFKLKDGETIDIKTQEAAQDMLVKVGDAIVEKDKIRAEYGAMQNRLENTLTNLKSQAENLQASESRISDADIAREMTDFVRNQILTQSAVAMLSQANSMPQMVMRLVGA